MVMLMQLWRMESTKLETLLTNMGIFILIRGKLYTSCVHELYVTWRRNMASEEIERVDTSVG